MKIYTFIRRSTAQTVWCGRAKDLDEAVHFSDTLYYNAPYDYVVTQRNELDQECEDIPIDDGEGGANT